MRVRIATLAVVVSMGTVVAVALAAGGAAGGYAMRPDQAGAINLSAVPLGDGYVSSSPKIGYVDSCITSFGGGGAFRDGPWINSSAHTWDYRTKLHVSGSVRWASASYEVSLSGSHRVIKTADLPIDHTTGTFPIASSDPAYSYDRNPNHIAAQSVTWSLPGRPSAAAKPSCTPGGPIGVLEDGVVLYNALDGGGRDAGAHEVLDACAGHPDQSDTYHHHDVPPCILSRVKPGHTGLVGYALDGYGIYVVMSRSGSLPNNTSLDACHGTTSRVPWNGRMTRIYHYVATIEYPYTVGCFHGTAISSGRGGAPGGGGPPGGGVPPGSP